MFYVYILKSDKDGKLYIGYSNNLQKRFKEHNLGLVESTKSRMPLHLIYYEAYTSKEDATKREHNLKTGQQRELLRNRLINSMA